MDNTELINVHEALAKAMKGTTGNELVHYAFRVLSDYMKVVENPNKLTKETHKIASIDSLDTLSVFLTPVLDRMHMLEPTVPVHYSFSLNADDGAVLVTLEIEGLDYTANAKPSNLLSTLRRCKPFIEAYVDMRKGSDGCSECGAQPSEICLESCSVLSAEILLGTLRRLTE